MARRTAHRALPRARAAFNNGSLRTMKANYAVAPPSAARAGVRVIRPLCYTREAELRAFQRCVRRACAAPGWWLVGGAWSAAPVAPPRLLTTLPPLSRTPARPPC